MIGVIADPVEHDVVGELFELFKTPWELARAGRRYDVLLTDGTDDTAGAAAPLVLVYAGGPVALDATAKLRISSTRPAATLSYGGRRLPLYGRSVAFRHEPVISVTEEASGDAVACVAESGGRVLVRVGYDLFHEVRTLLTVGQPPANAGIPALELHIDLLRRLIVERAGPLVEIPPVPAGYDFIACLTHDLDHPSIRWHRWDRTTAGFAYRAVVGSIIDVARRRRSMRGLLTNWAAVARLPLVHLGLAEDFWWSFDRYLDLERGLGSTFFVIPFAGDAGRTAHGPAPAARAARYGVRDIAGRLRALAAAGSEIGVHGIDAWIDSDKGHGERLEVSRVTEAPEIGVRMHWLYGDGRSAATLEKAGFSFDSTIGYNDTVGYRAGTTQVFKPLDAIRLLELPLHVMDTALFYPAYLDLSSGDARDRVRALIDDTRALGGVLTINWHDRSIAPERLWGDAYVSLLEDLKAANAWFPTASGAVAWFRKRRAARFDAITRDAAGLRAKVSADETDGLPPLRLRIHHASGACADIPVHGSEETCEK